MPIFEYICKECEHEFEALVFGKQKAECPKCQGPGLTADQSCPPCQGTGRIISGEVD